MSCTHMREPAVTPASSKCKHDGPYGSVWIVCRAEAPSCMHLNAYSDHFTYSYDLYDEHWWTVLCCSCQLLQPCRDHQTIQSQRGKPWVEKHGQYVFHNFQASMIVLFKTCSRHLPTFYIRNHACLDLSSACSPHSVWRIRRSCPITMRSEWLRTTGK